MSVVLADGTRSRRFDKSCCCCVSRAGRAKSRASEMESSPIRARKLSHSLIRRRRRRRTKSGCEYVLRLQRAVRPSFHSDGDEIRGRSKIGRLAIEPEICLPAISASQKVCDNIPRAILLENLSPIGRWRIWVRLSRRRRAQIANSPYSSASRKLAKLVRSFSHLSFGRTGGKKTCGERGKVSGVGRKTKETRHRDEFRP